MSLDISLMNEEEEASKWETLFAYVNKKQYALVEDGTKDAQNLPCLIPIRTSASKALSAKKVRASAVISDNKESIRRTRETIKTSKANEFQNGGETARLMWSWLLNSKLEADGQFKKRDGSTEKT